MLNEYSPDKFTHDSISVSVKNMCQVGRALHLQLFLLGTTFSLVTTMPDLFKDKKRAAILLVAPPAMGHIIPLMRLGEMLVKRGHQVGFCSTEIVGVNITQEGCKQYGLKFLNAGLDPYTWMEYRKFTNDARSMSTLQSTLMAQWIGASSQRVIVDYLDSPSFQEWDIAVFDFMLEISGMYLADKWGVVVVFNSVTLSFTPMLLPYSPFPVLGSQFPDNMTFIQRFVNTLILPFVHAVKFTVILRNIAVIGTKQCPSISRVLYNGASVGHPLFINSVIGFEFPRSYPSPMTHYTGPLIPIATNYSSSGIPLHIANWLDIQKDNYNGVILISMGSTAHLTHSMARAIIESVQQTNLSAIWSLGASEQNILDGIPFNETQVFVVNWMPQRKVLNHPSIKIAMLHGGLGGIQEAVSSKVPIICLPQMFDQRDNAVRVEFYHLGVTVDPQALSTDNLVAAIKSIINRYFYYKKAVVKVCKLFKAAGGLQKVSELIELYQVTGYSHLKNAEIHFESLLPYKQLFLFVSGLSAIVIGTFLRT